MALPQFACFALTLTDGIAEIRFTRPELLNRFDAPAHEELCSALRYLSAVGPELRVLVLSAEGRAFSAGGDFEEILQASSSARLRARMHHDARSLLNGLIDFPVPVISAIHGAAIGLGATIAAMADIVVAWKGAKIADTHVNVGLVAGDGGVLAWSQAIGITRAKRHLLTGDPLTGTQAYALGLVTDLVDNPEDALPVALALAERIRALPPEGVNGTRRTFAALTRARMGEAFELGISLELESMTSDNLRQTVEALRAR